MFAIKNVCFVHHIWHLGEVFFLNLSLSLLNITAHLFSKRFQIIFDTMEFLQIELFHMSADVKQRK